MFSLFDLKIILRTAASWGKKIFLIIFVYAVVVSLFIHFIGADKKTLNKPAQTTYQQNRLKLYTLVNNPELKKTKEGKKTLALYRSMICGLTGDTCTDNPADAYKYQAKSLTGQLTNLFMLPLMNPPASGVYWAYTSLQDAGFVPNSYAAEGIGFSSLRPIMNLWKVFRDVSYMLLVVVLIAIGFMIMFRMKINPQTVINIENALPRIVVAMLLITFSFAIAGFLIDMMYVLIAIIVSLISGNGAFYDIGKMQNNYLNGNATSLWDTIFNNPANLGVTQHSNLKNISTGIDVVDSTWNGGVSFLSGWGQLNFIGSSVMSTLFAALPPFISGMIQVIGMTAGGFIITTILVMLLQWSVGATVEGLQAVSFGSGNLTRLLTLPIIGTLSFGVGFNTIPYLLPVIFGLAIFFTILFLFFRIFFMLFKAYLQVIFLIIIAPFMLLFEAVPGKSSFSTWIKHLMADVFTFPIVIAILTIGFVLSNQLSSGGEFWRPPFLNVIDPSLLPIFIGMGVVFMTPDLVKLTKEQLFGIKDLPINFGFGTFFAGAGAAGAGGMSLLGQLSTANLGMTAVFGEKWSSAFGRGRPSPASPHLPSASPHEDKVNS